MKDRTVDPVNKCPYYSREYIISGTNEDLYGRSSLGYEITDICNNHRSNGICLFNGKRSICRVFTRDEEED